MITPKRLKKITQVVSRRQHGFVVVFEDVYDPHNAAAVLRSADAFGIQEAYFIFEQVEPYDLKMIGKASSSSANKWIDIKLYSDTKTCMDELHTHGYHIAATVANPEAESIFQTTLTEEKIAILFGNEHSGLSTTAIDNSDRKLTIPMAGMVQSLNISVTAGICMFEITRQRTRENKSYTLPREQQQILIDRFIKISE